MKAGQEFVSKEIAISLFEALKTASDRLNQMGLEGGEDIDKINLALINAEK